MFYVEKLMQKILFLFLIAIIFIFQLERIYGGGGDIDDGRVRNDIIKQNKLNQDLINLNNQLIIKTSGLKGSSDAIEARARLELNMVKGGETLVLLPGNDSVVIPTNSRVNAKVSSKSKK